MSAKYEKLKTLLRELFQLDQPDLDFGIYRIMHARSSEIGKFLDEDLLPQVSASFAAYQPADRAAIKAELDKAIFQAQALGADAETLPKVKELRAKLANEAVDIAALEGEVYDHLYSFFRRYYSEGDFISKRVYKEGVYAIPYEGEEVKLHWANSDQYYIKTSEYLRDYAFRLQPDHPTDQMRVHFRLVDAQEGEHGNIKEAESKTRLFILSTGDFISEENGELIIKFEYRPATLQDWFESERNGKTKPPAQKELLAQAEKRILGETGTGRSRWLDLLGSKHRFASGEQADYCRLAAHLNRYTARNTFDYFIHKDLGGFLKRELDFYIKNEVMHLDDVENEIAPRVEQYLSKIKVIRRIATKIIDFLAQLENFQKKLWLKKKFVVETNYCITLDRIPEEFYPEIAANDAQREEWVKLYAIDEICSQPGDMIAKGLPGYSTPLTIEFLKANNKLVLDSKHFPKAFKNKLISAIEEIDSLSEGLLIHSENFQALALLKTRFSEQINCVYIDPPYNTNASKIIYKNEYEHSSWASLLDNRLALTHSLMTETGVIITAIDDYEQRNLQHILDRIFGRANFISNVAIMSNPKGRDQEFVAQAHDYSLIYAKDKRLAKTFDFQLSEQEMKAKFKIESENGNSRELPLKRTGSGKWREDRPYMFYPIIYNPASKKTSIIPVEEYEGLYDPNTKTFNDGYLESLRVKYESSGLVFILPQDSDGAFLRWRWGYGSTVKGISAGVIFVRGVKGGGYSVFQLDLGDNLVKPKSLWYGEKYDASSKGTNLLAEIIKNNPFDYPKSLYTVIDSILFASDDGDIVTDYFAGSGTTAHAAIQLCRERKPRKYICIEMGDHFNTVVLPRTKKVVYSQSYKNGKPTERNTGISQCFKYIRLESYEDTLYNLELKRTPEQQALLDLAESEGPDKLKEDYTLRYLLDIESRGSPSLLSIDRFLDPTAYKLKVKKPGSDESSEVAVDLIETFNYLIGLKVSHISEPHVLAADFVRDGENRLNIARGSLKLRADGKWWFRNVTGSLLDGRRVLVIWRKRPGGETSEGLEQDNLVLDEWFKSKQGYSTKDSEFDLIYVNGTNNLENLKTPDDLWKVRLIEEDFFRLMFEDTEA